MTDIYQFAVTDNHMILADMENVGIDDCGLLDKPSQNQTTNYCKVPADCTDSRKRLLVSIAAGRNAALTGVIRSTV